jgi:23S rRNA (uracil1939-C5)-methyltransferase
MTYKKDDFVEVTISDCGNEGEGIGKVDGYPFFIKDAIIGDVVRAKVMKTKKSYAYARLVEVLIPSEKRCEPKCPVHKQCGGCQIQAMSYEEQLKFKENKVKNHLIRIGGMDALALEEMMEPIIGMENPWRYRNKAQYPIGRDKEGQIVAGFYAGRTHSIIANDNCLLSSEKHKEILRMIIGYMEKEGIEPYDELTHIGVIRHVLIREGFQTGQVMVCLVVNMNLKKTGRLSNIEKLAEELFTIKGMKSFVLNENSEDTNVILGRNCKTVRGKDFIEDILCGLRFRISPLAFYQVNPVQAEKLYGTALEFADLSGEEEVWDICCGIGTITLALAQKAGKVHGLEIVDAAIEDAKQNACINGVTNVDFICAPAEVYMPLHKESITADVIVVDPPRKGMDERSLEVMTLMSPEKIVYVSCDSATLARDIKYLQAAGYELKRVRTVDMFPHSVHVETCCLLCKMK